LIVTSRETQPQKAQKAQNSDEKLFVFFVLFVVSISLPPDSLPLQSTVLGFAP
jgi:hypothetical protein